jgi:hypothetical protein
VLCLSAVGHFVCYVYFCVVSYCSNTITGKHLFAIQLNSNNNKTCGILARDFVCFFDINLAPIFKVCRKNVRSIYRECSKNVKSILISLTTRSWREWAALYDKFSPLPFAIKQRNIWNWVGKEKQNVHKLKSGVHYKAIKQCTVVCNIASNTSALCGGRRESALFLLYMLPSYWQHISTFEDYKLSRLIERGAVCRGRG